MSNILDKIIANKRREVAAADAILGPEVKIATDRTPISLRQALLDSPTGIIAEFKRRSPSKARFIRLRLSMRLFRPIRMPVRQRVRSLPTRFTSEAR